ncbi:MAG: hypothetical protein GXY85_09860 [Candidatus Brocadiaceae bacterium]|nr:hypothetical protein [Candidatus Brocadiaceae bacterium]
MPARCLFAALCALLSTMLAAGCGGTPPEGRPAGRPPRIEPDYIGVTVPPNIAPLNFRVAEPGRLGRVELRTASGRAFAVRTKAGAAVLPAGEWRALLQDARGDTIRVQVSVQDADGGWTRFDPFEIHVAQEEIDSHIVYRELGYVYMFWGRMRLRQRDISSYDDIVLLDNDQTGGGCMNCHSFLNGRPDSALVQVRSGAEPYGHGMLIIQDGRITKVDTKTPQSIGLAALSSWHPSGRAIAYSMDVFRQFFHSHRTEVREVYDMRSDLALYLVDEGRVTATAAISRPDALETYPAWSADGKHLYFSRVVPPSPDVAELAANQIAALRYDLVRIPYDVDADEWGQVETVLSADQAGGSITQPRPSPDGRFVSFCLSDHSVFPTFQPDADIYVLSLADGSVRRLACSGEGAESRHSWSSNSRWIVFSSKRDDGVFIRPYFAHVDESGQASKPFILPQKDPAFYGTHCYMYQFPEFLTGPLPVSGQEMARAIRYDEWHAVAAPTTGATAQQTQEPGQSEDAGLPWRAR